MILTPEQKRVILQTVNAAETGSPNGDYSKVTVVDDDPKHPGKEISYGRSQLTEYGRLRELIQLYISKEGEFKHDFIQYLPKIGTESLSSDRTFIDLLKAAGKDKIMQETQDSLFEKSYFLPALNWAAKEGFTYPLSLLIIYDSFIQSGGILQFLRNRFPAATPSRGGTEKSWIGQYTQTRHDWLTLHSLKILQKSAYRTTCYISQINKENWTLSNDLSMNGIMISGAEHAYTR